MSKNSTKYTPGYYLREIRNKYALKQFDLEGGSVTRSKIAKIESNNKNTVLTKEYAQEIANNINNIISVKYNETIDYMMFFNNDIYKSILESKSYIDQLEKFYYKNDYTNFTLLFNKFVYEFSQYDIPDIKLIVYKMAGKFYMIYKEYYKSYIYYSKAVDNALAAGNHDEFINNKISLYTCLMYTNDCEESIRYLNDLLINNNLNDKQKYHIYNKLGHSFFKLKKYEQAIDSFENSEPYVGDNISWKADIYSEKAYCHKCLKDVNMTEIITKEGLDYISKNIPLESKDQMLLSQIELMLYKNLVSAYKLIDNKKKMIEYIDIILKKASHIAEESNNFIIELYVDLFDDFMYLDNYDFALEYCNEALRISTKNESSYYINKVLGNLLDLYIKYNKNQNIKFLIPRVRTLLTDYNPMEDNNNVVTRLLKYYLEVDQNNISSEIKELLNLI